MRYKEENMAKDKSTEKNTTIQLPVDLKNTLDAMKLDPGETYAGVIKRLLGEKPSHETISETVHISIPRKLFLLITALLPPNITDEFRKGVH